MIFCNLQSLMIYRKINSLNNETYCVLHIIYMDTVVLVVPVVLLLVVVVVVVVESVVNPSVQQGAV